MNIMFPNFLTFLSWDCLHFDQVKIRDQINKHHILNSTIFAQFGFTLLLEQTAGCCVTKDT